MYACWREHWYSYNSVRLSLVACVAHDDFHLPVVLDEIRADLVSLKVGKTLEGLRVKFPETQVIQGADI